MIGCKFLDVKRNVDNWSPNSFSSLYSSDRTQFLSALVSFLFSSPCRRRKRFKWPPTNLTAREMERRYIPARATRIQSHQRLFACPRFPESGNFHFTSKTLVAKELAWIGDQIELRRGISGRLHTPGLNIPRLVGRSLAVAGDLLDCKYKHGYVRRNDMLLRLLWRGLITDDVSLVFVTALLQMCYLGLHQMWQDLVL